MQDTLKAQNGLKHFRAIANSRQETPMKLARADAHCLAKLINATGRMAGQPMERAAHQVVSGAAWFMQPAAARRLRAESRSLFTNDAGYGGDSSMPTRAVDDQ